MNTLSRCINTNQALYVL